MFDFSAESTTPGPKCYFTHSLLPPYIDPIHPPNKKQPFATISKQRFSHTLDLILPEEIYTLIADELRSKTVLHYALVYMKLGELIASEFFNTHIKTGNIMMLSEGRPGIDDVFSLYDGTLRLELGRAAYERCGLQGTPIEDGGKKHKKARFVVEYNMREPYMVHGKKGFGRLVRACEEVLDRSLSWLFYDFNGVGKEGVQEERAKQPIDAHQPIWHEVRPDIVKMDGVLVPKVNGEIVEELHEMESSMDLLEWLHLVGVDSPRVRQGDRIDEFLSRYRVPDFTNGDEDVNVTVPCNLVRLRWRGFTPPLFIRDVYLLLRKNGIGGGKDQEMDLEQKWFAMTANAFGGYGGCYTVLQFAGRDTLSWECD
jgi:ribonuclease P/MRP protein subunit RPP40